MIHLLYYIKSFNARYIGGSNLKILGIIAEYNPMHNGHIYHISKAKEETSADYTILVMSGSFTQTGNIACLDKFTRAKIATSLGVDLALELPTIYATASSEYFASGAIKLLNSIGVTDYLCFGGETDDVQLLSSIADKIIENQEAIWENIRSMDKNISFARNRSMALMNYLDADEYVEISKPNNILGIEYIKAIKKQGSKIKPVAIKRIKSGFHSIDIDSDMPSSTSIRFTLRKHNLSLILSSVPGATYYALMTKGYVLNDDMFKLLKYKIETMSKEELSNINEIKEGLENKIKKAIIEAEDYEDLLRIVKSKRYSATTLKRIFVYIMLNITKDFFKDSTEYDGIYAHVLAMNKKGKELLSIISKSSKIPIFTSINDNILNKLDRQMFRMINLDIFASNTHSIIANNKLNLDYTNKL